MKKQKRIFFIFWVVAALGIFFYTDLWAQEEFQARLFPEVGPGSQKAEKIIITVDSYTTSEEIYQLVNIYNNRGYDEFRATLQGMKKGILRPTGGRGMQIILHAAQSIPTDKGRKITLVGESQSWNLDSSRRYDSRFPFLVIELKLNEKGKGSGNIYLSADIKLTSEGTIEKAAYNAPPRQLLGAAEVKK
jgi:hypothetical protein